MTLTAEHIADLRLLADHHATPADELHAVLAPSRVYALERRGLVEMLEREDRDYVRLTALGEEVLLAL